MDEVRKGGGVAGEAGRGRLPVERRCGLCGGVGRRGELVRAESVRHQVALHIAQHHPERWTGNGHVCRRCLNQERAHYVVERLEQEKGALTAVEAEVAGKAGRHLTIAADIERQFARSATAGQRAADSVARLGGSWGFVLGFVALIGAWVAANSAALARPSFDPYPYILLNLILSCLAALQAPIIMMAQNRQAARDRLQADHDYRVNLKSEIEIASLHEKVDHVLHAQWERMVDLQQIQIDLLSELAPVRGGR